MRYEIVLFSTFNFNFLIGQVATRLYNSLFQERTGRDLSLQFTFSCYKLIFLKFQRFKNVAG